MPIGNRMPQHTPPAPDVWQSEQSPRRSNCAYSEFFSDACFAATISNPTTYVEAGFMRLCMLCMAAHFGEQSLYRGCVSGQAARYASAQRCSFATAPTRRSPVWEPALPAASSAARRHYHGVSTKSLKNIPALQTNSGQNFPATLTSSGRTRPNSRRPIPLRRSRSPQVFSSPRFEKYTSGPFRNRAITIYASPSFVAYFAAVLAPR